MTIERDVTKLSGERSAARALDAITQSVEQAGYTIAERDDSRPWGGFLRLDNGDADRFIEEFFPGLTPEDARLGNPEASLSPKFLYVNPRQRLSWQMHHRRAERWAFLTPGGYHKSADDEQGELVTAQAGDVVQFAHGERHRLVGDSEHPTIVAEIWQHVDPENPSDESDIVRIQDDYSR